VAEVFHVYVEAPDAVNVVVFPEQTVDELTERVGLLFTTTCVVKVAEQPKEFVPETE
jgi:hypothetical protein